MRLNQRKQLYVSLFESRRTLDLHKSIQYILKNVAVIKNSIKEAEEVRDSLTRKIEEIEEVENSVREHLALRNNLQQLEKQKLNLDTKNEYYIKSMERLQRLLERQLARRSKLTEIDNEITDSMFESNLNRITSDLETLSNLWPQKNEELSNIIDLLT